MRLGDAQLLVSLMTHAEMLYGARAEGWGAARMQRLRKSPSDGAEEVGQSRAGRYFCDLLTRPARSSVWRAALA